MIEFPQKRAVAYVEPHQALGTWQVLVRWVDGHVTREGRDFAHPQEAAAEAAVTNGWAVGNGK